MRGAWPQQKMVGSSLNKGHLAEKMKWREREKSLGTGTKTSKEFVI